MSQMFKKFKSLAKGHPDSGQHSRNLQMPFYRGDRTLAHRIHWVWCGELDQSTIV